jgi:hypothetical protein
LQHLQSFVRARILPNDEELHSEEIAMDAGYAGNDQPDEDGLEASQATRRRAEHSPCCKPSLIQRSIRIGHSSSLLLRRWENLVFQLH